MTEIERLRKLSDEGEKIDREATETAGESSAHLPAEKIQAWAQILSSIASAEGTEEDLMAPLMIAYGDSADIVRYLRSHARDELRHEKAFRDYVRKTFSFERKKKTLTDHVIYDGVLKNIKKVGEARPLVFLAGLLFYESLSGTFYGEVQAAAERDGLPGLAKLMAQVEKDELRHRAGVKALIALWGKEKRDVGLSDLLLTKSFIGILNADVNTERWAVYNRRVRGNMRTLGLAVDRIGEARRRCAADSFDEVRRLRTP